MSDNFIPLNQSTPVQSRWQQDRNQQQRFNNRQPNGNIHNQHNNFRNSSRSSHESNTSNNSYGQARINIDEYLHPAMMQDPWANLRNINGNIRLPRG
nr:probable basic-leucine zipper transcription factor N [Helicoverpa armigera]